jgi:hypothetical protein
MLLTSVANLPLGVVDTRGTPRLQLSPRFLGKIRNDPNVIFRGLVKDDS